MRQLGFQLVAILTGVALVVGCKAEDGSKAKRIDELTAKLDGAKQKTTSLQDDVDKLNQQVETLKNDLAACKKKPCDCELKPVVFTAESAMKPSAMGTYRPGRPMSTTPATRPEPMGPTVDLSQVPRKVRKARYAFKACYQNAMKKNSSLQVGSRRVALKFTVLPTGRVIRVMIVPPIGSGFEPCIRSIVSRWRFSKFKGGPQRFVQRMTLRPQ